MLDILSAFVVIFIIPGQHGLIYHLIRFNGHCCSEMPTAFLPAREIVRVGSVGTGYVLKMLTRISLLAMVLLKLQCLLLLSISINTLKQILTSFTEIFKLFYLFLQTTLYNYSRSIIYFQCNLICQTPNTSLSADFSVVNTFNFGRGFNCPHINNRRGFYCPKK